MTKLGVQPPDEEKSADSKEIKDPKVFTVVQPTFVPIPVQQSSAERKRSPSTWGVLMRLFALIFFISLFFSLAVFALWSRDDIVRALYRDQTPKRVEFSQPAFSALNSQQQAEQQKEETVQAEDGAQITIKQTDRGTQMLVQLPKGSEEEMLKQRQNFLQMGGQMTGQPTGDHDDSSSEDDEDEHGHREERPMHPYEMEAPSPDYYNFHQNPWAMMQWRQAQYENEMREWKMRRMQQMAAMQQREAAMRHMMWMRQQWMAQQMAAQQAMMQRQAEMQEYLRRVAVYRMMQQQQEAMAAEQMAQPRPMWGMQPQQQPFQWHMQPPMMPHPQMLWQQQQMQMQQQMQPQVPMVPVQVAPQSEQGPQVPQAQPLLVFQQPPQPAEQQPQQQPQQVEEEQPVHSFIFIRRFFPIPQDQEQQPEVAANVDEASQDKNVPLRPHDASAQQIVEQMKGTNLPPAPIPGIQDRIFQRFQSIAQQLQANQPSQPPIFSAIPIDAPRNYDQDKIYQDMQRKAMEVQKSEDAISSVLKQEPLLGADDHDVRRGEMALTDGADTPKVQDGEVTTTAPVMIENLRSQPEDSNDAPTEEELKKTSQLDPVELREAAALEASLEREAKEEQAKSAMQEAVSAVMEESKKDSEEETQEKSEEQAEEKKDESKEEEHDPKEEEHDPLADFFRFFENEAVKLSADSEKPERVVVDSESGVHPAEEQPTPMTSAQMDEEASEPAEIITKPDEQLAPLTSSSSDEANVSNEANVRVQPMSSAESHEMGAPIPAMAA